MRNDHGYFPFVKITIPHFPHSSLTIGQKCTCTKCCFESCNKSNTTGIPIGVGTAYPCILSLTVFYVVLCAQYVVFVCGVLQIIVCHFSLYHCAVSDSRILINSFGIFKLFSLYNCVVCPLTAL